METANQPKPKPGSLRCDRIDLSQRTVVAAVLKAAILELRQPSNWHKLTVHGADQFRTVGIQPPDGPGWYVITDESDRPLYVGEAEDLNRRLNSSTGSLDNFHNSKRSSDPIRNFLKYFLSVGILERLKVGIVRQAALQAALSIEGDFSKLDRCNVEKLLDIFRAGLLSECPKSSLG